MIPRATCALALLAALLGPPAAASSPAAASRELRGWVRLGRQAVRDVQRASRKERPRKRRKVGAGSADATLPTAEPQEPEATLKQRPPAQQ